MTLFAYPILKRYITNSRFVSSRPSAWTQERQRERDIHTQWVAARQLGLLSVLGCKDISNAVQELHVALFRVLLQSRNEGPRHGTSGLVGNCGIGAVKHGLAFDLRSSIGSYWRSGTYDVWSSLLPDHMITSAGEVLVSLVLLYASSPLNAVLAKPKTVLATPAISPRA